MNNLIKTIILILTTTLLAGCWDSVELEDKAFSVGIAVDQEGQSLEGDLNFRLTDQVVVAANMSTPATQGGGDGDEAFRNLTNVNDSLHYAKLELAKLTNRQLSSQHIQVFLVSEQLM